MARIILSYQHQDAVYARRLQSALVERQGAANVFSIAMLGVGEDYREAIGRELDSCLAMVVVIGPSWAGGPPGTYVRGEIAAALSRRIRVFPVLVGGAHLPSPHSLPDDIRALAGMLAIELGDGVLQAGLMRVSQAILVLAARERDLDTAPTAGEAERQPEIDDVEAERRREELTKGAEAERRSRLQMLSEARALEEMRERERSRAVDVAGSPDRAVERTPPAPCPSNDFGTTGAFDVPTAAPSPPSHRSPPVLASPAPPAPSPISRVSRLLQIPKMAATALGSMFTLAWGKGSATAQPEVVKCSVFAPPQVHPGDSVLVQVFAHLEKDDERAKVLATTYDPGASPRGASLLSAEVARGTQLSFGLTIPGAQVDEPVQTLVWQGSPGSVQFGVAIPRDHPEGNVLATVTVSDGTIPIGRVKFIVSVVPAGARTRAVNPMPEQEWKRYQHAFISYASPDRAEVLKRVQMLDRVSIDFFQDLLSLDPGERWAKALYKNIDKSDVFFLFWSTAAKDSEWVMKEVRYAIERRHGNELAPPEIIPVIIEGPPLVPPPQELKDLHFNDRFLYFIAGSPSPS